MERRESEREDEGRCISKYESEGRANIISSCEDRYREAKPRVIEARI